MPIRVKVKFYVKKDPRKGEWTQVILYPRKEDREKLREYNGKEVFLFFENEIPTVESDQIKKDLLDALVKFFISAFKKRDLTKKLIKLPEANNVMKLLEGVNE